MLYDIILDRSVTLSADVNSVRTININVFHGGKEANLLMPLKKAIQKYQESPRYKVNARYYNCDDIKSKMLSEKQFVDLMLNCDIHFIITHIHQNMDRLNWNMVTLYNEVLRLQAHNGFPTGPELECPMFTQNKIEYLRCLIPLKIANPTLKINFNDRGNFDSYQKQIAE